MNDTTQPRPDDGAGESTDGAAPPVPPVPPVPPSQPVSPVPSSAPIPPGPPSPADPVAAPPSYSPATAPSRSGRTAAIVVGIVAACLIVLGGLGVAVYFIAQSAISALAGSDPADFLPDDPSEDALPPTDYPDKLPLLVGDPGPTVAASPTLCPESCFVDDDFGLLSLPDADYVSLGLSRLDEYGDYADLTAQKELLYAVANWESAEGEPAECFPVSMYVPVAVPVDGRAEPADDPVGYLGYAESENLTSYLNESARLFRDSATAEAHLATLLGLVAGCREYDLGTGTSYWTADVTPMPALDLPDSVAAVGWVEDSPFGRYYAVDLQRANVVVRLTMYTDGSITEESFREFAEAYATQFAAMATE